MRISDWSSDVCSSALADRHRTLWQMVTTGDDTGDFRGLPNRAFFVPAAPSVQMAIVKKNVAPLKRLIATVQRTPHSVLRQMKILLVRSEERRAGKECVSTLRYRCGSTN